MIQGLARELAQKEIAQYASRADREGRFPKEGIQKLASLGLMGVAVPEDFGGSGLDNLATVLALEEIAAVCASTAVIMSVNNSLVCDPLKLFGTQAQKQKFLTPLARGEKLGCFCLSEPNAGSDAANQQTRAKKDGDSYVLSGTKNFITNGPQADAMIVFAMTDKEKRHKGISAFIVEKNFSGFNVGKVEKKMGIRASSTSEIVFKNCEVPVENRLGEEGDGFKIAMTTLDGGRIGIATQALGIARAAFETAAKYSTQREAFGQTISQFQGIQWKLADMAMNIDAARLLIHRAAWMKARGERVTKQAAMAKLFASEMAMNVTKDAIQVLGGYGYCREYPVERYFRDAKITEIYEGTSEIQRIVIAREVLKEITS